MRLSSGLILSCVKLPATLMHFVQLHDMIWLLLSPDVYCFIAEDCLYGDSKAPFYDGFRCSNVSSQPWNCYKSTVAEPCCGSCRTIRNNNLRVIGIDMQYGLQLQR